MDNHYSFMYNKHVKERKCQIRMELIILKFITIQSKVLLCRMMYHLWKSANTVFFEAHAKLNVSSHLAPSFLSL